MTFTKESEGETKTEQEKIEREKTTVVTTVTTEGSRNEERNMNKDKISEKATDTSRFYFLAEFSGGRRMFRTLRGGMRTAHGRMVPAGGFGVSWRS